MSSRDSAHAASSSTASAATTTKKMDSYHSEFCSPTADFVVQSSDGLRFKCHRLFLEEASPVFRTMLSLPQPTSSSTHVQAGSTIAASDLIEVLESSATLEILMRLIYPMPQPDIDSLLTLSSVLFAAEKYDMAGVISTLRLHLRDERFLSEDPMHVFALACRFSFTYEAKLASRASLKHNICNAKYKELFIETGLKTSDLFTLMSLRHSRIDGMQTFLDGEQFEGNAADFTCVTCEKKLNDITWPLLKASILKELYKRPLGDTIFSPEFLKSSAIQSFINSKCDECQERLIYEKGKTLAMVSEFLKSMPDSLDICECVLLSCLSGLTESAAELFF